MPPPKPRILSKSDGSSYPPQTKTKTPPLPYSKPNLPTLSLGAPNFRDMVAKAELHITNLERKIAERDGEVRK